MPSSPPTSMPWGISGYLLSAFKNLLHKSPLSKTDSSANHRLSMRSEQGALDIGLTSSDSSDPNQPQQSMFQSMESALQKATDCVANSVRPFLKSFNPISPTKSELRLLVFGSHSFIRAKYLTSLRDFPTSFYLLHTGKPQSHGGIFWSDDASVLAEVDEKSFDAVLCFNISSTSLIEIDTFLQHLERVLKPGGCFAGTGLFKGLDGFDEQFEAYRFSKLSSDDEQNTTSTVTDTANNTKIADQNVAVSDDNSSSSDVNNQIRPTEDNNETSLSSTSSLSVRHFRHLVEERCFYVHSAIDMSLEGNVILQLVDEVNNIEHPLGFVRSGALVCTRFLATKNAPIGTLHRHRKITAISARQALKQRQMQQQSLVDSSLAYLSSPRSTLSSSNSKDFDLIHSHTKKPTTTIISSSLSSPSILTSQSSTDSLALSEPTSTSTSSSVSLITTSSLPNADSQPGLSSPRFASSETNVSTPSVTSLSESSSCSSLSNMMMEPQESIVVTGVSLGLPHYLHPEHSTFDPTNFEAVFTGTNFISNLTSEEKQTILSQNVCQMVKKNGQRVKYRLTKDEESIQLCSKLSQINLVEEYGVPAHVVECLDTTYKYAIAAGLEALVDAGIPVLSRQFNDNGKTISANITGLPESMRDETGVIFASSFPALDSCVEEVSRCVRSKVKAQLEQAAASRNMDISCLFEDIDNADNPNQEKSNSSTFDYEYDRKLLFKLLVMANCQLAELIKARGPNTQINAACASTSQAITIAEDWIRAGRCRRVIVISADNATSDNLLPYLGTGFLALGAATTVGKVTDAAVPFDRRRKGMILGSGAVGIVIETASASLSRSFQPKVEILGSHLCNSAYHGCLMHGEHITSEFAVFMKKMELQHGIDRSNLSKDCIYFSHETCTSANGGCAKMEMDALEESFGPNGKKQILLANTKGFTGHPMAVGMEEAVAVVSLITGRVPPIANYQEFDPILGELNLPIMSKDTNIQSSLVHDRKYAIRFSAGFGSQFIYIMYKKWTEEDGLNILSRTSSYSQFRQLGIASSDSSSTLGTANTTMTCSSSFTATDQHHSNIASTSTNV